MAITTFETVTTDHISGPSTGYSFGGGDWQMTIAAGVAISSTGGTGIQIGFFNDILVNHGTVFSGAGDGVFFASALCTVRNMADGFIIGEYAAIDGFGSIAIYNYGALRAIIGYGIQLDDSPTGSLLVNRGEVRGHLGGVLLAPGADVTAEIDNFRLITADQGTGIIVATAAGHLTTIDNAAAGVIRGSSAAIQTNTGGRIRLDNDGTVDGRILCEAAGQNDRIINHGKIKGSVVLGPGDDVYSGGGGTSGHVFGGDGIDRLTGGAAKDQLHGGPGSDILRGAGNADRFWFDATLNGTNNVDRVNGFQVNVDKLVLDNDFFFGAGAPGPLAAAKFHIGAAAHDRSDRFIYNPDTGYAGWDGDGTGDPNNPDNHQPLIRFAFLGKNLALDNMDVVIAA